MGTAEHGERTQAPEGREGGAGPRMRRFALPVVALAGLALAVFFIVTATPNVVFEEVGDFGTVRVVEGPDGLRQLYLGDGRARQTALYPRYLGRLEVPYTRVAMVGPALAPPDGRILFVGLGGGAMPSYVRRLLPEARIDVVEIDPLVVRVAREWFGFREDPGMRVHVGDGRAHVEAAPPGVFDLVVLDAFSDTEIPRRLATREFLQEVRRILADDGVVIGNLHTTGPDFDSMVETYRAVFGSVHLLRVAGRSQVISVAGGGARRLSRDTLVEAARALQEARDPGFDLVELVGAGYTAPAPSDAPVLEDGG